MKSAFTKVIYWPAWWRRVEFYLLQRNAIYKRVFYFTVGFGSRLLKKFCTATAAREHRTPRNLRNIWQELFHKNRKRNPSTVTISCCYAAGRFRNCRLSLFPELLTSARNVLRNDAIPLMAKKIGHPTDGKSIQCRFLKAATKQPYFGCS